MRELDFIPAWYPKLLHKKRLVILQGWFTASMIVALSLCLFVKQQNIHAAEFRRDHLQKQLGQAASELQKLNELQSLKAQMSRQAEIVSQLGPHIPVARLLDMLDELMPKEMALLDFSIDTEVEASAPGAMTSGTGATPVAGTPVTVYDRRLNIKLHGVAPSDAELGVFLTRLQTIPHLSNMQSHGKDRVSGDHLMRDFEVTFVIHLDQTSR